MARTTVEAQLLRLRKQRAEIEKKEKALLNRSNERALAKIVKIAKDSGVGAAEIAAALKGASAGKTKSRRAAKATRSTKGTKVAPKFRNPANSAQTWTGRGKMPLWVKALSDAGTLDSARIAS
jgi:DNA-binding protein H-NS